MTTFQRTEPVRAILLDLEGTTTPIDFVYRTLFPYARDHVKDYLARRLSEADVQSDLKALREERTADERQNLNPPIIDDETSNTLLETAVAYLHWLMGQDRKSTPLKSLQGKIWEEGYRSGALKSDFFADVPRALERWRQQNRRVCIYSSGSVLAQRLLFAHTALGDLTGLISGYFDTNIGAKREAESYRRIANILQLEPAEMIFVSDVTAELDAARSAEMQTLLAVRPGNTAQPRSDLYPHVTTFDTLYP